MPAPDPATALEQQIEHWRSHRRRRGEPVDADALEERLRAQIASLRGAGLTHDEAFLVALRRIGEVDEGTRDFSRAHAGLAWKELAGSAGDANARGTRSRRDAMVASGLAVLAALAIKAPELLGLRLDEDAGFYARNLALFVLPLLTAYFVWKRGSASTTRYGLAAAFVAAAVFANVYSVSGWDYSEALTAIHLPIALWLAVGIAHAGGRWSDAEARMEFVRHSGEHFIYYVLIALGGVVLTGLVMLLFQAIGIDMEPLFERWILPCGAIGAVVIAAWLVEAKQGVVENMAPVLTRLFTPLFAIVLIGFLATMTLTGRALEFQRDLIIAFDLLLVVVLGLLLYSISARDPRRPAGAFDVLQVVLLVSALLVDAVALWSIAARITEFGFTPNRVAALGENLILLVNLAGSAVLYVRFLRGRGAFGDLERWQTSYLPVYAGWAAIVVAIFPPLFRAL